MNTATAAVAATDFLASLAKAFPAAHPDDLAQVAKEAKGEKFEPSTQRMLRRQLMERMIVRSAVTELASAGYFVRLHDGEDWATGRTQDPAVILEAIMACDEESLSVLRADTRTVAEGRAISGFLRCATISLVYGNDGYDVIADYSTSLEKHLKATNALAEKLGDE